MVAFYYISQQFPSHSIIPSHPTLFTYYRVHLSYTDIWAHISSPTGYTLKRIKNTDVVSFEDLVGVVFNPKKIKFLLYV